MPKPKAKSAEEKQAALDQLLSRAATTNHLTGPSGASASVGSESGQAAPAAPGPIPGNEEQKGEDVLVAPADETPVIPVPEASAPALPPPASTPHPSAESTPTPVAAPMHAPAPTPVHAPEPEAPRAAQTAPVAATSNPNAQDVEHSNPAIPEPETTVEVGTVELGSLFIPSADKKVFTMRLTDAHYQYLLLLGTIVGNGASPPDIVHNILAQFIDKNDAQIQKAITKQLRQRQSKK